MGWWISRAPQLEEDVALANSGLDQLGQARTLLAYAGTVGAAGRDEDDLGYFRDRPGERFAWGRRPGLPPKEQGLPSS
jgi:ring-1,2-phenylacetyl-CoA epoxidase subunit PaaC